MNNIKFNLDYIIDEYSNYVFKIAENIGGASLSYQDKEEIVSDTFFLLWKNQDKINTDLKSYLGVIARNCSYDKLRKKSKDFLYDDNFSPSYTRDIDSLLMIKEKLKCLTLEEQSIFKYYYNLGLKVKEIAVQLNKKTSYVKVKLYRIRKKLKEDLSNE